MKELIIYFFKVLIKQKNYNKRIEFKHFLRGRKQAPLVLFLKLLAVYSSFNTNINFIVYSLIIKEFFIDKDKNLITV